MSGLRHLKAIILITPIKPVILAGSLLLIYILRGIMVQDVSYKRELNKQHSILLKVADFSLLIAHFWVNFI